MFDFLKPKNQKRELLEIDTGEGKGSYGELLNPPKPKVECITGMMPASYVSGIYVGPWATGFMDMPKFPPNHMDNGTDLSTCPQCEEPAWDGRICHVCGAKNI